MSEQVTRILLNMPFRLGSVNCYLLQAEDGFVLIDTGSPNQRATIERELERAGCQPGDLRLILLTHGDFDHTGNAAHLSRKYRAPTAMHPAEAVVVERGQMFASRGQANAIAAFLVPYITGFRKTDRFSPDRTFEGGEELSEYGLDARVLWLPGHSQGSIGVLTAAGALFCGDLLTNRDQPGLTDLIDDSAAANASLEKLDGLTFATVYPGHGEPFSKAEMQ